MAKTIKQRRLAAKTDYKARLALLKSNKSRLIIRKTNRYIIIQIVESNLAQDKVIFGVSSKDLLQKGWPKEKQGSLKSFAASYLTGFMFGKKAKLKFKEAILDMGMQRNIPGSRIYAALKGVLDAGLNVPHNPQVLPKLESIKGKEEISKIFDKIKEKL